HFAQPEKPAWSDQDDSPSADGELGASGFTARRNAACAGRDQSPVGQAAPVATVQPTGGTGHDGTAALRYRRGRAGIDGGAAARSRAKGNYVGLDGCRRWALRDSFEGSGERHIVESYGERN